MEGNNTISTESSSEEVLRGAPIPTYRLELIIIRAGEDILNTLILLSERTNCFLLVTCTSGSVREMSIYHGDEFVFYEGGFEIVNLSGFVCPPDTSQNLPTEWTLSMAVARQGGSLTGGKVTGAVITATNVLVNVWMIPPNSPIYRHTQMIEREIQEGTIGNRLNPQLLEQLDQDEYVANTCTTLHF